VEKYRKIFQKNTSEIFRNFPEKYEIFRTIFPPHITTRDVKQVRNLGQAIRSKKPGKALHNAGPIKNIADDTMSIINGIQDNDFIQSVVLLKGKSPLVIAYLPQQTDMRRFCNKDTQEYLHPVIVWTGHLILAHAL